jgi:hypothetical protein
MCHIDVNDVGIHMVNSQHRVSMTGVIYSHIIDTYKTPVIRTKRCELIMYIHTSLAHI